MKIRELYRTLSSLLPIADIRTVFDGYFCVPFDSLPLHEDEEIDDEKAMKAIRLLKDGYPANYLVGYIDIFGMHLTLNKSTLIPRTETEDFVANYLPSHYDLNHKKVLDLCTGSGFIALAVKKLFPSAEVLGTDISEEALQAAEKSAKENHLNVNFRASDYLENITESFDFILCNPPYIEEDSKEVDAPYEPKRALFSGKDGLDSYRAIFPELGEHLSDGGYAFFELESTNSQNTLNLFKKINPRYEARIAKDLYGRDRYLLTKKN